MSGTPLAIPADAQTVSGERPVRLPQNGVRLLLQLRLTLLRNMLRQAIFHHPLKIVGTSISILLIWLGIYAALSHTFYEINRRSLEGIVAMPLIFTFFFLALTGMLTFSNAILSYGSLFRQEESTYLLAGPLLPREIVTVKYIETIVLSSWSLLLLGVPLMLAIARQFDEPASFYPMFLGLFLAFIPIPGAIGLLLAWIIAMVSPKTPKRTVLLFAVFVAMLAGWWLVRVFHQPVSSSEWLTHFYDRMAIIQHAVLPHTWVSKAITSALQDRALDALFYLVVTCANALFASVLVIGIVSGRFVPAFARAQVSGAGKLRRSGKIIALIAETLFAYLPKQQRLLAVKDTRSFCRDPLQWSQMAILFGLLVLYVSNIHRIWVDISDPRLPVLIGFLNMTAVSLILATFTSRFVFPLVSLEGQQIWLLGLLPLARSRMIIAKFLYALTITIVAAVGVISVSAYRLQLSADLVTAHLVCIITICVGLCGVSIGMGARLPMFKERNPARIAGGFGGTIGLLVCVALVVVSLAGLGMMSFEMVQRGYGNQFTTRMVIWLVLIGAVNMATAAIALFIGIRHFNRLEF